MKWQQDGRTNKLETGTVSLNMAQDTDAGHPEYTRRINRIGSSVAKYNLTIGTLVFIVLIAIGATYVRGQVLEKMLTAETVGSMQAPDASSDGLDMSAGIELPAADTQSDAMAVVKAQQDSTSNDRHGGWGTFIVLAIVFVALQVLGMFFGFHWGFAGQNSKDAYIALGCGRFSTYSELIDHFNHLKDVAQARLEDLQQRLMERNAEIGTSGVHAGKHTIRDYLREARDEQEREHHEERDRALRVETPRPSVTLQQPEPTTTIQPQGTAESALTMEAAMAQINTLSDKEAKLDYIASLPEVLQNEVIKALKQQKEEASKKRAELEDLL
jgi:hypothetical protein